MVEATIFNSNNHELIEKLTILPMPDATISGKIPSTKRVNKLKEIYNIDEKNYKNYKVDNIWLVLNTDYPEI
jgi:hypothetical protein